MADPTRQTINVAIGEVEGNDHHFDGNQYKQNTANGEARAIYGEIEDEGPAAHPELQSDQRGEPLREAHEAVEVGPSQQSQHLSPPAARTSRNLHDRSSSRGSETSRTREASPEAQITITPLHVSEFQRRGTGSWFNHGTVFEISADAEKTIANRCMVVVGKASDIVCLPLCRHKHITDSNTSFLKSRLPVMDMNRTGPERRLSQTIEMKVDKGRPIHDDIFINCQKPYTIHHQKVRVAFVGELPPGSFENLKGKYLRTQEEMTNQSKQPTAPGAWWDSLTRYLRF